MVGTMMRLSDLADFISVQIDPAQCTDSVYVGLEHIASGRFTRDSNGKASDVQSSKYAFKSGDVLYGKLRPYLDKAVLVFDSGICTTELLVLRPKEGVDPRFLVAVIHTPEFIRHAVSGVTGVQHPRTSWNHIGTFEVQAFDSSEQSKISDLLWLVDSTIASNETTIEIAKGLKHTAMRVLFTRGQRGETQKETEIGLMPESWEVEPLGTHHSVVSGGTPSRRNPVYWQNGTIPWVKTTEIDYCIIRNTEEFITLEGLNGSAAKLLPPGTLLLAMYGQGVTRGKVAILEIEAACNQACAAIRSIDRVVDHIYLYHYLAYRYEEIRQLAHGGQQQNLNLDIVRNFPISFPNSNSEQQEISTILDAIDRKIDLHRHKHAVLNDLFKALLHNLVTGNIHVNDLELSELSISEAFSVTTGTVKTTEVYK